MILPYKPILLFLMVLLSLESGKLMYFSHPFYWLSILYFTMMLKLDSGHCNYTIITMIIFFCHWKLALSLIFLQNYNSCSLSVALWINTRASRNVHTIFLGWQGVCRTHCFIEVNCFPKLSFLLVILLQRTYISSNYTESCCILTIV